MLLEGRSRAQTCCCTSWSSTPSIVAHVLLRRRAGIDLEKKTDVNGVTNGLFCRAMISGTGVRTLSRMPAACLTDCAFVDLATTPKSVMVQLDDTLLLFRFFCCFLPFPPLHLYAAKKQEVVVIQEAYEHARRCCNFAGCMVVRVRCKVIGI